MHAAIHPSNIKLSRPFGYALGTLTFLPYAKIEITTTDGITGIGEIACALDVNGESQESAAHLQSFITAILKHEVIESESDIARILHTCNLKLAFNTATKCGIEQALYEILAQKNHTSLAALLGAKKERVKIQCTIPFFKTPDEYLFEFAQVTEKNPDHIKLKVGNDLKLEEWALKHLREMDADASISIDGNQTFATHGEASEFLSRLSDVNLGWAEQLIERGNIDEWAALKKSSHVPLMADESIHSAEEALPYLSANLVDYVNIKLAKSGGIIGARKIIRLAEKWHVPVMLGGMLHSELGLKYNLCFALGENFVTHDFYSYFSLKEVSAPSLIDSQTLWTTEHLLD